MDKRWAIKYKAGPSHYATIIVSARDHDEAEWAAEQVIPDIEIHDVVELS